MLTFQMLLLILTAETVKAAAPGAATATSDNVPTSTTTTTTEGPPVPFKYAFSAGRIPGGNPDRYVEQEGDGKGVIKGSYAYLDPNWKWQKVNYQADGDGFHILEGSSPPAAGPPQDTPVVAAAKARHSALFQRIADRHRSGAAGLPAAAEAHDDVDDGESEAVKEKRREHAETFARIAAEHAKIAADQARISSLAQGFGEIYD